MIMFSDSFLGCVKLLFSKPAEQKLIVRQTPLLWRMPAANASYVKLFYAFYVWKASVKTSECAASERRSFKQSQERLYCSRFT